MPEVVEHPPVSSQLQTVNDASTRTFSQASEQDTKY